MFSALRQNSDIYLLDKTDVPTLKIGQVASVSTPQPKIGINYQFGQPTETFVDISVCVGEEKLEFKQLPSALNIANFGNVVITESKEAMNNEVESMIRNSKSVIESIPYHEEVIKRGEEYLLKLNPAYAEKKAQEEKIGALEDKMSGMESALSTIQSMLKKALDNKKE